MGRGNKRITTWEQICLMWIMMIIWGGLLFLFLYVIIVLYNLLMGY